MKLTLAFTFISLVFFTCSSQKTVKNEGFLKTRDGIEIFYEKIGNGPEVIIIPGGMYLSHDFKQLASDKRTLIFYDQRCRGKSETINEKSRIGISYELSDLESIRTYFGYDKVSLIGWSYSGAVVILYAIEHPHLVKRIVQIGPIPPRKHPHYDQFISTLSSRRDSSVVAFLNELHLKFEATGNLEGYIRDYYAVAHKALKYDQSAKEQFRPGFFTLENERPDRAFGVVSTIIESFGDWDFRKELENITMPILTVHGDYDAIPLESAKEWSSLLPNGRLLVVSNTGHLPWFEKPKIIFPSLDIFLNGNWPENTERF